MNTIVTTTQMRNLESRVINEFGTPARVLMELAGKGCVDAMRHIMGKDNLDHIIVLCGRGNNGGDGAVIARWFHLLGATVTIIVVGKGNMSPDTSINLQQCRTLQIAVFDVSEEELAPTLEGSLHLGIVLVDAIYGTGFRGPLNSFMDAAFNVINSTELIVVAVDIPSGIDGDTGTCQNCINAALTLAIGSYKYGHFVGKDSFRCGDAVLVDIGLPEQFFVDIKAGIYLDELDIEQPSRFPQSHKGDYGRVVIFGGTRGYTGAAALASRSALRAGCGYVHVLHRPDLGDLYACKLTEALCFAIPETQPGVPDTDAVMGMLSKADSVLIGPGFGKDAWALSILTAVLEKCAAPLVVDADALNLISENPSLCQFLSRPNVLLTPHWGEFCRLAGCTVSQLQEHYLQLLSGYVNKHKARVLLKSHFTVYKDRKFTFLAHCGNDGLATGGSGDVLAGIIASFLAQGTELQLAAIFSSLLLGKTASDLARKRSTASILPSDIIDNMLLLEEE